jgi:hypothetical protein
MAEEVKHTPGPWSFSEARTVENEAMVLGGKGQDFGLVAVVTLDPDARLIAAAPELLDVLQVLWEAHGVPYELAGRVEKAIAKATGGK